MKKKDFFTFFNPLQLQESLPVFSPSLLANPQPMSALEDYLNYYQLPSENSVAGLSHRMAHFDTSVGEVVIQFFLQPHAMGTLWLIHGYLDHVGIYADAIRRGLAMGYNVFVFDFPGHGLSSGKQVYIDDFMDYVLVLDLLVQEMRKHLVQPWYAVAQSMGGAILSSYCLTQKVIPWQKLALFAPLVRVFRWERIRWMSRVIGACTDYVGRRFEINSHHEPFLHFQRQDILQSRYISTHWVKALLEWEAQMHQWPSVPLPVLIFQGNADKTVDFRYNLPILLNKFKGSDVVVLEGAYHHLLNEAPSYQDIIWQKLNDHFKCT